MTNKLPDDILFFLHLVCRENEILYKILFHLREQLDLIYTALEDSEKDKIAKELCDFIDKIIITANETSCQD